MDSESSISKLEKDSIIFEGQSRLLKYFTKVNTILKNKDLPLRNTAIHKSLKYGYTQGEVARYIGVSSSVVSYVYREKND